MKILRHYFLLALYIFIIPFSRVIVCSRMPSSNNGIGGKEISFKIRKRRNESSALDFECENTSIENSRSEIKKTIKVFFRKLFSNIFSEFFIRKNSLSAATLAFHPPTLPIYLRAHTLVI